MNKTESGWSEPQHLDAPFGGAGIMYATTSLNGNMYFTKNDETPWAIYVSRYVDGAYQTPEKLGSAINKGYEEAYSYIAPDESYIIFSAMNRPDGYGARDMYISFRRDDGSWTESINLGNKINTTYNDFMPFMTTDGMYFIFTRSITNDDLYWCDTKFIDQLRSGIKKFVFLTYRYGYNEICTINADGTGFQRLTTNSSNDDTPAFSPDGEKIAFCHKPDQSLPYQHLYVMNYDGSNVIQLTSEAGRDYFPDWSPDGTKIAFSRYTTGSKIYVYDLTTGIETQLTFGGTGYEDNIPDWFPDGDSLLFTSGRDGIYQLYIMNPDGTNQHRVVSTTTEMYGGKLSPDGTKIAYDMISNWSPFRDEIYLINTDGTGNIPLTAYGVMTERPDWSPDGTEIVFQSTKDGSYTRLYIMNADGTNTRMVYGASNRDFWPIWGVVGAAPINTK
jgi:Tol biopolymer transport system component